MKTIKSTELQLNIRISPSAKNYFEQQNIYGLMDLKLTKSKQKDLSQNNTGTQSYGLLMFTT